MSLSPTAESPPRARWRRPTDARIARRWAPPPAAPGARARAAVSGRAGRGSAGRGRYPRAARAGPCAPTAASGHRSRQPGRAARSRSRGAPPSRRSSGALRVRGRAPNYGSPCGTYACKRPRRRSTPRSRRGQTSTTPSRERTSSDPPVRGGEGFVEVGWLEHVAECYRSAGRVVRWSHRRTVAACSSGSTRSG